MKYIHEGREYDASFEAHDVSLQSKDHDITFKNCRGSLNHYELTVEFIDSLFEQYYGKTKGGIMKIQYWIDGQDAELCWECTGSGIMAGNCPCKICKGIGKLNTYQPS